ncbi:unnamed protein product [Rhizoctonia solani]|uniref:Fungal-type protein kinase domain-containing protein n=1 Tax=Rhizoctonia solani TaxID=456999 RepID=A0A8H3BYL8_9AGAM|nr:unnamed protein product [Rhizoctonia solani]
MEFKKKNDRRNQSDDFVKVAWSMHHTMRNDPCRKYVHGLTCEDAKARLWFSDRCDLVASEDFDVNKGWKHLVRIILSILSADPTQLGYDPSIGPVRSTGSNSEPSYDIRVYDPSTGERTVYRTLKMISDVGADSMVGCATRVWEVRKFVNGDFVGPSYALKDVWVHEDRETEHVILERIRGEHPDFAEHLLTPIDYARASNPGSRSQKTPSATRDSVGHSDDITVSQTGYRDFNCFSKHPRQHYRIIFKEIGTPVHDLRSFTDVFTAIEGGWKEHSKERGVIMDLEYAKKIRDKSASHDVKTGTAAFMATEVAFTTHYRFDSVRGSRQPRSSKQKQLELLELGPPQDQEGPKPPFRHNPLHDIESIWWLCIWVMFYLAPTVMNVAEHHEHYSKVNYAFMSWVLSDSYSICYEKHENLGTPSGSICVGNSVIDDSYESGLKILKRLRDDSKSLRTCVTLAERTKEGHAGVVAAQSLFTSGPAKVYASRKQHTPK